MAEHNKQIVHEFELTDIVETLLLLLLLLQYFSLDEHVFCRPDDVQNDHVIVYVYTKSTIWIDTRTS